MFGAAALFLLSGLGLGTSLVHVTVRVLGVLAWVYYGVSVFILFFLVAFLIWLDICCGRVCLFGISACMHE